MTAILLFLDEATQLNAVPIWQDNFTDNNIVAIHRNVIERVFGIARMIDSVLLPRQFGVDSYIRCCIVIYHQHSRRSLEVDDVVVLQLLQDADLPQGRFPHLLELVVDYT